jgi:predicted aldo/keto reductase-like oxidoreductase
MSHHTLNRRQFIKQLTGGAAVLTLGAFAGTSRAATATDRVLLGKSGIEVSRLGIGTGTNGGRIQREMGQPAFTRMIRHALDRGITFFDTADNYKEMHEMLGKALEGVDRESIQIQSKISPEKYDDPLQEIDRFRKELGTDYFDTFLIHCARIRDWYTKYARLRDQLQEAKEKQIIRSYGLSVHGMEPLEGILESDWPELCLLRTNHNGHHMDGPSGKWRETGNRDLALQHIKTLHDQGKGIVGMKLVGNGDFTWIEERRKSVHFVMALDYVDAVVIGFKSPQEIDEMMGMMEEGLARRGGG